MSSQTSSQGESRPNMRRKSSASNLLMRAGQGGMMAPVSVGVGGPQPIAIPSGILYSAKDTDAQSTFSDGSTAVNPGQTNLDYLQTEIVKKRLTALTYLRNVHEGKAHWIGTLHLARQDLERAFSNAAMKKRTTRFAVLAMSLSPPIESPTLLDMLRTVSSILAEYEQFQDENYKPARMRIPGLAFRSSRLHGQDGGSAYLVVPNLPFALDYRQVLLSFVDVLSELYHRLGTLLAQLQQQQQQQNAASNPMSPPATWTLPGPPLVPQHGVEYIADDDLLKLAESAHGTVATRLTALEVGSPTGAAGAGAWNATVAELVLKVDGKFRKILATLFKELDDLARQGIRDELASLDPLLRNVASLPPAGDDPYDSYDI